MASGSGTNLRILARGLRFPEGPIALADGSVLLVEVARGTLTRVRADEFRVNRSERESGQ